MRGMVVRGGAVLVAALACCAQAAAQPVSGPRETVDNTLTTTRPNAPTGTLYSGVYHAAGDPNGRPPYMRRMVAYPPRGFRYDTSVPARCTASDEEIQVRGPSACPAASRVGGGGTRGLWMNAFEVEQTVDIFNAANQQIFVVHSSSGVASVARGQIHRDGSIEFASPTCYPSADPPGCPVDNALQLATSVKIPALTRVVGGKRRSYLTTAPRCPRSGAWRTPIRFWWADGSVDTIVTKQACRRPGRR